MKVREGKSYLSIPSCVATQMSPCVSAIIELTWEEERLPGSSVCMHCT